MSYSQDVELLKLLRKADREAVSPRLEAFRKPARIKGCHGGRGAGAKSWSIASLLIQAATVRPLHIACLREVQLTLEESVWKLLRDTIERLKYTGWTVTKESINHANGSHIIFRGISDLRADQLKSLEGFDIFWIEEAQSITEHSLDVLMPTIRKEGSELWFSMNREKDVDPIIARLWNTHRTDAILVALEPGEKDNPWWTKELETEMQLDFARDPELALHIWNGLPRNQDPQSIFSRDSIRAAMERRLEVDDNAPVAIGVDVARFGDDLTVIFKRRGMKVVGCKKLSKADTQQVAREVWDMAGRDSEVPIMVDDSGVGGGVTDKLNDLGANVIPVLNGDPAWDDDRFTTCADEQWFNFPIDSVEIPDDPALMEELSGRVYFYTPKDQKKIEPKKDYKKRYGSSPDCFIAGTLIRTDKGNVPIEIIKEGDKVFTPFGLEKVVKSWESPAYELVTITLLNGEKLTGKPKHRAYTENGFIPIDKLLGYSVSLFSYWRILIWQIKKLFSTKAQSISYKHLVDTFNQDAPMKERDFFTGEFGLNTMGLFQRDILSTMLTGIGGTIVSLIWYSWKSVSMRECIQKKTCKTLDTEKPLQRAGLKLFKKHQIGIDQQGAGSGTPSTGKKHGRTGNRLSAYARPAEKSLRHSLREQSIVLAHALINILATGVGWLLKYVRIAAKSFKGKLSIQKANVVAVRVVQNLGGVKTYNLTLTKHNVYYANNILVENCADALLLAYYVPRVGGVSSVGAGDFGL